MMMSRCQGRADAPRAQLAPDEQPRAMEPRFDGPFVEAHHGAHFLGAESFHVAQHQDHAIFRRQPADRLVQRAAKLFVGQGLLGGEAFHRDLKTEFPIGARNEILQRQLVVRLAFALAAQALTGAGGDRIQPGGDLGLAPESL